jgi:hypothetical protein
MLFGGEDREGGVSGLVDISSGHANQPQNAYLKAVLGKTAIPAFRGVCTLVFKQFYIGLNPYLKNISIQAKRTNYRADGSAMWFFDMADINGDMNPAHVIYELYTDKHWGLGLESNTIDDDSFRSVAIQLFDEDHGISFIWDGTQAIEDVLNMGLTQINGIARQNIKTGKIELKLIRDDYDIDAITVLDESVIIKVDSFQRSGWEDTVNQVTVIYHDEITDQDKPVTVQDLGNINIQNRIVPKTITMSGVSNAALAQVLAMREIKVAATPLSSVSLTCKRGAYGLNKGDVFLFKWAKYGIAGTIYRVGNIDYGDLTSSQITVTAIEDVFAFEDSVYTAPMASEWASELVAPEDLVLVKVVEATYWDSIFNVSAADRAQLQADYGFIATLAARSAGTYYSYGIHSRVYPADYQLTGSGSFAPTAIITPALTQEVTSTFAYTNGKDLSLVVIGHYAYINDEIVAVTALDITNSIATVNRGVLDTVPVAHAAGSRIWFAENGLGHDLTEWSDTDTVGVKLTPVTSLGSLDIALASEHSITLANRAACPYPPANVTLNGERYPSSVAGDILVAWSHRDRTLQTVSLIDQVTGNIGPEPGTTYTMRLYSDATLLQEQTGIATTSHTFTSVSDTANRIVLFAVRNGLQSWQVHSIGFSNVLVDIYLQLLIMPNGIDNSVDIVDSSPTPKTITVAGNARVKTSRNPFGLSDGSIYFDGSGDYFAISNTSALATIAADFCLDGWGFSEDVSSSHCIASCVTGWANTMSFWLGIYGGKLNCIFGDGDIYDYSSSESIAINTDFHFEFSRTDGVLYLALNGVIQAHACAATASGSADIFIGSMFGTAHYFAGNLSYLRFRNGAGGHTTNFTPPMSPPTL